MSGPAVPARAGRAARVLALVPALLWMGILYGLSSQSDPLPALTARVWDKALHLAAYAVLGLLLALPLRVRGVTPGRALVLAAALTSLYGATDEVHQWFVPGRSADPRDWLADTLGGALGAAAFTAALRVVPGRASIRRARGRA